MFGFKWIVISNHEQFRVANNSILFFLPDKVTKRCLNKQVHIPGIDATEQSQAKGIRATDSRNNKNREHRGPQYRESKGLAPFNTDTHFMIISAICLQFLWNKYLRRQTILIEPSLKLWYIAETVGSCRIYIILLRQTKVIWRSRWLFNRNSQW